MISHPPYEGGQGDVSFAWFISFDVLKASARYIPRPPLPKGEHNRNDFVIQSEAKDLGCIHVYVLEIFALAQQFVFVTSFL